MKSKAVGKKASATGKKKEKHGSSKGNKSATDESGAPAKSLDQFLETWSDDDEDESGKQYIYVCKEYVHCIILTPGIYQI